MGEIEIDKYIETSGLPANAKNARTNEADKKELKISRMEEIAIDDAKN